MQASRPHRQYAPALSHELGRFLDVATILAAQGKVCLPTWRSREINCGLATFVPEPATVPEWVASFPEAALLRGTCRAAYGDRALLGWVGAYPFDNRCRRIERFVLKRRELIWEKVVKYDVRKSFADQRLRVKGRFVKKEDENVLRDFLQLY